MNLGGAGGAGTNTIRILKMHCMRFLKILLNKELSLSGIKFMNSLYPMPCDIFS